MSAQRLVNCECRDCRYYRAAREERPIFVPVGGRQVQWREPRVLGRTLILAAVTFLLAGAVVWSAVRFFDGASVLVRKVDAAAERRAAPAMREAGTRGARRDALVSAPDRDCP